MIISIDVDNTIADFNRAYKTLLNNHLPSHAQLLDDHPPTYWFDREPHLQEAVQQAARYKTPEWWRQMMPVAGVVDAPFWSSFERRHHLYFITHRPVELKELTASWIDANLGVMYPTVVCTLEEKSKVASLLGVDVHIDDDPSQVESLVNAGIYTILLEYPYNKEFRDSFNPEEGKYISMADPSYALRLAYNMEISR